MLGAAINLSDIDPEPVSVHTQSLEMNNLMSRIASREDRDAFEQLFLFFAPRLKGYLMKIGTSSEIAEDLAQEALVKVWRKAKQFDEKKASASTWIFTIARNLRIDAARRSARPQFEADYLLSNPEPEILADEKIERTQRDEKIKAAIATLPPNQLQVIELHFIEDAAHSEISRRLDLPLGTVKSRLRLAFQKIRQEIGDPYA